MGVDAGVAQHVLEMNNVVRLGTIEGKALHLIIADQVYIGAERFAEFRQLPRLFGLIVDTGQKDVFQRHLPAAALEVISRGVENIFQGEMLGPGNQLLAQCFIGGVQGDRQVQRQIFIGQG